MKNNRITPESQKTRLPFAMFLYIALAAVICLGFLHTFGNIVLGAIADIDAIIQEYLFTANLMGDTYVGNYDFLIIDALVVVIEIILKLLMQAIPFVICALSLIIAILMMLRKRNLLLFIPTVILAVFLGIAAIVVVIAIIFLFLLGLILIPAVYSRIYPTEYVWQSIYSFVVLCINYFASAMSIAALATAFSALSLLFVSCGKGVIGIFKRAKKLCFIIFCVVLGLCLTAVTADLIVSLFWHLQNLVQQLINLVDLINYWEFYLSPFAAIIDIVILPLYSLLSPRPIMNILCLIAVFFTGTWLYFPHKKVKKKKRNIDLVEYVELEYGDDNEVTMEVVDGDNDDEFVNISVHRQKTHDDE